jgi:hypothetical protein
MLRGRLALTRVAMREPRNRVVAGDLDRGQERRPGGRGVAPLSRTLRRIRGATGWRPWCAAGRCAGVLSTAPIRTRVRVISTE